MNFVGIDPGATGGISVITPSRRLLVYPFKDKTESEIASCLQQCTFDPCTVYIEKVHSMPGQGVVSMFKFGQNLGFLRGCLVTGKVPFFDVTPQQWQKGLGLGKKYPTRDERKRAMQQQAQQWFPGTTINRDVADSVLIAEYGYVNRLP